MFHLIKNADVHAPKPLGIKHLLICAGKIVYIGNSSPDLDRSLSVNVTDIEGAKLVPGFIDAHAHITGGGGEAGPSTRVPPLPLSQFTQAGVTSVIGLLGTDDLTRNPQTLLTQVMGLREEGLSAWCYTGGYHIPAVTLTASVRSDIVNLEPCIGVGEVALSDHRSSQPSRDEVLRLASEAHVAGLMTGKAGIVHFHLGDGKRGLAMIRDCLDISEIPSRVFNPTHVNRNPDLFEEACELTKLGCTIDMTASANQDIEAEGSVANGVVKYMEKGLDMGKLTVSSDGGGCLPDFNDQGELVSMDFGRCAAMADAFRTMATMNLSLEVVLPLLTSNVSDLLKLHHKGRIETGMDADLLVIDSGFDITGVMAKGVWHIQDGRQLVSGFFE